NRRKGGTTRGRLIALLPSIPTPPDAADRIAFWRKLHERFAALGNQIDAATAAKLMGGIHARIPMVTPDGQRDLHRANLQADAKRCDAVAGMFDDMIAGKRAMIAQLAADVAALLPHRDLMASEAERSRDNLARLERGEDVSAGLGKPPDITSILRKVGMTD